MREIAIIGNFPGDISLIRGGVQASVFGLAAAMRARSDVDSVTVIAVASKHPTIPGERNVGGLNVNYLTAPTRYLASSVVHVPMVLKRLGQLQHPVFHIHGTELLQACVALWLRARGYEFVWTLHGVTRKETLQTYRRKPSASRLIRHIFFGSIERLLERLASRIIVDTRYVTTELKRKDGVFVIPQGIFTQELGAEHGELRDSSLILSIGVFSLRKGHHHLLEAFATLRKSCPTARLAIAGAKTDHLYYEMLIAKATDLGCKDAVLFYPDSKRSTLIKLLHRASIFALHSEEESQGIAICEALFVGLPVVATRVGGIPDVVEHGRTGLLSEYGDISEFAESLRLLLSDPNLRNAMSSMARETGKLYDWSNIANRVDAIYRSQPTANLVDAA